MDSRRDRPTGEHSAVCSSIPHPVGLTRTPLAAALLIACPLLVSGHASALGLGQAEVKSALGQPLEVTIPVRTHTHPVILEGSLEADVPGYRAHQALGYPSPILVDDLLVTLIRGKDEETYVRLTSRTPVREPILSFVVRLTSAESQIVREYGLILDPPLTSMVKSTAALGTVSSNRPDVPAGDAESTYGPVRIGETLYSISRTVFPDHSRALAARLIFEHNRHAFLDDQNQLLAGSTLKLPTLADLEAAGLESKPAARDNALPKTNPESYGPVRAGETLYGIARRLVRDRELSIDRAMALIVASNPQAFIDENPDLLRKGVTLDLSALDAESDTSPAVDTEALAPIEAIAPTLPKFTAETHIEPVSAPPSDTTQLENELREAISLARKDLKQQKQIGVELDADLQAALQRIDRLRDHVDTQDETMAILRSDIEQVSTSVTVLADSVNDFAEVEGALEAHGSPDAKSTEPEKTSPAAGKTTMFEHLALPPVILGGILGLAVLLLAGGWYWRSQRRKYASQFLDRRDSNAQAARERLALLRQAHESMPDEDTGNPDEDTVLEMPLVKARTLAMEAAAMMAYGDFATARTAIDEAIRLEPKREEHKLLLFTLLESTGQNSEAKELAREMFERLETLPEEVRVTVEQLYGTTA